MGWDRPLLRTWLAMLGIVLAVTFAASSTASAVDHVQHEMSLAHEHAVQLTFNQADHDHHPSPADHHAPDAGSDDDQNADDAAQPGAGHHHADAPSAALQGLSTPTPAVAHGTASLSIAPAEPSVGVRPGGLERPPRDIAILV